MTDTDQQKIKKLRIELKRKKAAVEETKSKLAAAKAGAVKAV